MAFFFFACLPLLIGAERDPFGTTILDEDWKKAGVRAAEPWIGVRADMIQIRDWELEKKEEFETALLVLAEGATYACKILKFTMRDCANLVTSELNYLKDKINSTIFSNFEERVGVAGLHSDPDHTFIYDRFLDSRARLTKLCGTAAIGAVDCATLHRLLQRDPWNDNLEKDDTLEAFLRTFPRHFVEDGKIAHDAFAGDVPLSREWLFTGAREGRFNFLDSLEPPPKLVVDVGANRGDFTALLVDRWKGLTIHQFEPNLSDVAVLRLREYHDTEKADVRIFISAASDEVGVETLYVPDTKVAQPNPYASLHRGAVRWRHGENNVSKVDVPTITLDVHFARYRLDDDDEKINLLKIDTEGNDLRVLRGATSLLTQNKIDVILFEYGHIWSTSSEDTSKDNLEHTSKWLHAHGFNVFLLGDADPGVDDVALLDLTPWHPQFEVWWWSNVLAIHRGNRPSLAADFKAKAQRWALKAKDYTPCEVMIRVGADDNEVPFYLDRRDDLPARRRNALLFAQRYNLHNGAGCDDQSCIIDRLLDFARAECEKEASSSDTTASPPHQGGEL